MVGICALSVYASGVLPALGIDGRPRAAAVLPVTRMVPHVARPWHPGMPQLGVNLYWENNPEEKPEVTEDKIRTALSSVVSMGANAVSVTFPFVTKGLNSDTVEADPVMTPSPDKLAMLLRSAKDSGLYVSVRPILDEKLLFAADPKRWRGTITPYDPAEWFANYTAFLTSYATMAEAAHADDFYIGAELNSMEGYITQWRTLVGKIKSVYSGTVSYSMNYNRLAGDLPRVLGIQRAFDAYFPLAGLGDDATVAQVASGWNGWLDKYSMIGMVISETGIAARNNAYHWPYDWSPAGTPNRQVQQTWFTAACQVAQQRHVAGLYWWYVNLEDPPNSAYPMGFQGTATEDVVKHCFATFPSA